MRKVLGVDIGGVIIDRVNERTDKSFFGINFLRTPAVPGGFETLRKLAKEFTRIVLISKCRDLSVQEKTRKWLAHQDFYAQTGIQKGDVLFCRDKRQKSALCQQYRVTHFIDDRLEVLGYLAQVRHRYLFQPDQAEVQRFSSLLPQVTRIDSWWELSRKLVH